MNRSSNSRFGSPFRRSRGVLSVIGVVAITHLAACDTQTLQSPAASSWGPEASVLGGLALVAVGLIIANSNGGGGGGYVCPTC